jgi:hypothetical protein
MWMAAGFVKRKMLAAIEKWQNNILLKSKRQKEKCYAMKSAHLIFNKKYYIIYIES